MTFPQNEAVNTGSIFGALCTATILGALPIRYHLFFTLIFEEGVDPFYR